MKDKIFCLRLKVSSTTFLKKQALVLYQYFYMAIRVFQLNLKPTHSIYLWTIDYPQKGLNLLSLLSLDYTALICNLNLHNCYFPAY